MLAMVVNDNAGYLMPRGVFASIASMLAPTGVRAINLRGHAPAHAAAALAAAPNPAG